MIVEHANQSWHVTGKLIIHCIFMQILCINCKAHMYVYVKCNIQGNIDREVDSRQCQTRTVFDMYVSFYRVHEHK